MTPYEKATIAAFHHLWDTWNPPTATSVQESIDVWAETCKGFGTGLSEIWHKKDFR